MCYKKRLKPEKGIGRQQKNVLDKHCFLDSDLEQI